INREIHKFLGLPVSAEFHRSFLRLLTTATVRPLYAGYAQVIECFYASPPFINEIEQLIQAGKFVCLSKYPTCGDFLDARKRMYEWDKDSYPMYFEKHAALPPLSTQPHGDPDTTGILRGLYSTLYLDDAPPFEPRLTLRQRTILQRSA